MGRVDESSRVSETSSKSSESMSMAVLVVKICGELVCDDCDDGSGGVAGGDMGEFDSVAEPSMDMRRASWRASCRASFMFEMLLNR